MAKNLIADLRASLTWDLDDFEKGTRQIDDGFGKMIDRARDMATEFASVGKRMTQAITVPVAAMGAAFTARAVMFANDAKEIKVAAGIAGDGVEAFQRRAHAAQMEVGMSMEKLADISKDTMDKIGDYFATGGGELKEFFEDVAPRVGVTAEMFRGLSGPDALQLFYNTLDRANVSQQEMTFFLEAIADEGSALIPLLAENGKKFEELGKKANVFSQEDIERYVRLKNALTNLGIAFDRLMQAIAATGIIDWMAAAIEKVAGFVEGFAKANPVLFKMGVIALGVAAALGPLLSVLTTLAIAILPVFLAGLSPVFLALSALINPLGTLLVVGSKFVGVFGAQILPLLGRLALGFLGIAGPVGAAVGVLLLFADRVIDGLKNVWQVAKDTLGPSFTALFDALGDATTRVTAAFGEFSQSPIGKFLSTIIGLVGDLVEVLVTLAGSAVVGAINILLTLITALVEYISGAVEVTAKLLSGDWAGAWDAAGETVSRTIGALFPLFQNLWSWIEGTLVKLGLMEKRVASATSRGKSGQSVTLSGKTITDEQLLALGEVPEPRAPWRRSPDVSVPKVKRGGGGRTGPTAQELADRRAALELEHEIAVARERGDSDALRALERKRDLQRAIEQYERAGLATTAAKTAAEKDMLELDEARAEARAREYADAQRSFDMQLARIREDYGQLQTLEDEEFLKRRIAELEDLTASRAEAEEEARKNLLALEEARTEAVERRLSAQRAAHAIELAELRGDFGLADTMRESERIAARTRELRTADGGNMNEADAYAQALEEASERSRAAMQGNFRDAFRGGLRAAMDGNFWDWFKQRLNDSAFDALARVFDRLADGLADMLSSKSGGGGIFGAIGQALGLIGPIAGAAGGAGGHGGGHSVSGMSNAMRAPGLPKLDSGGDFRVRGFAGIDQNMLSLNGSPVAMVSQGENIAVSRGERAASGQSGVLTVRLKKDGGMEAYMSGIAGRVVADASPSIAAAGAASGFAKMQEFEDGRLD